MALQKLNNSDFVKPANFVGPALDAFLSVSQDMRAERSAQRGERESNQLSSIASQRNNRSNIQLQDNLASSAVNREDSIQRLGVFMEEAKFKREKLRPMQLEAMQLENKRKRFALESAREGELAKNTEIDLFQRVKEGFSAGKENGFSGLEGGETTKLKGRETFNREGGKATRRGNGMQEIEQNARLKAAYVENVKQMFSGTKDKGIARSIQTMEFELSRDPVIAKLISRGDLELPEKKAERLSQAEDSLRGLLGVYLDDDVIDDVVKKRKSALPVFSSLSPSGQLRMAEKIAEGLNGSTSLTPIEKAKNELRRKIEVQSILKRKAMTEVEKASQSRAESGRDFGRSGDAKEELQKIEKKKTELEAELQSYPSTQTVNQLGGTVNLPSGGGQVDVADYLKN